MALDEKKKTFRRHHVLSRTYLMFSHFPPLRFPEYRKPKALAPFLFCMAMIVLTRGGACAVDSIVVGTVSL
jgi:hypothetical protein